MWVSSEVWWRTEPIRMSFGGGEVLALELCCFRNLAKALRTREWFFSGRNWAM